ncbi:Crp/Fnr family transcriptional regulator [Chitinophaga agrisoli]|uniref:Crp/Fnr family transcriptional regulator n=1 Tax=Chitinophaga agrisoli TaxID=2607653 RepID=A0A5B2VS88_9BACT|nr:Crp/Fnr family transcriptional regulator [Chitinophaga agrisoli]KAA2242633.1 Crp/Fnr family transcriptional regulator [Chitinophaga agrisoli]
MFDVFEKYLNGFCEISQDDLELIRHAGTVKKLRKWQSLLHDGESWRSICFISSGCLRLYRYDENGNDHTVRFGIENWWIGDQESYYQEKPAKYNIEALAASSVILWTKPAWEELMQNIPVLRDFFDRLSNSAFVASQQRIYSLISASAEERYREFQETYPSVFNKVPLHMVASYLGISRETLSRVRKDLSKTK